VRVYGDYKRGHKQSSANRENRGTFPDRKDAEDLWRERGGISPNRILKGVMGSKGGCFRLGMRVVGISRNAGSGGTR